MLLAHSVRAAATRTFCTAGRSRPMRMAMMAITTSSSTSVKPRREPVRQRQPGGRCLRFTVRILRRPNPTGKGTGCGGGAGWEVSWQMRPARVPVGGAFVHAGDPQQLLLLKRRRQDLQAYGQIGLREAAGDADPGDAGEVAGHRVDVRQVHLEGVAGALADLEGRRRRRRAHDDIAGSESAVKVLADQPAHLQSLEI